MSEEKRAGVAVGEVICEASSYNRGGVRKRALLAKRERRRPSDETEHKLRSEDAFCQLRLGRENLIEFVWRDGVIAPYRFVWRDGVIAPYRQTVKLANYQTDSTCKLLSNLESRQVLQLDSLTVYQLYNIPPFQHSNIRTLTHSPMQ